jgi:signal transduction histidine kinase
MKDKAKRPRPERDNTDDSLRAERKNSDRAIAERRGDIEANADVLVARARVQADAVLDTARDRADHKLDSAEPGARVYHTVAAERAREDDALQDERVEADERLRSERAEEARTLASLLPLEREKTDRYLLTERARSDDAIEHRDDFMGMVSHDLRNLLSGITGNATLLSKHASESDEGRRTVAGMDRIKRYAARMNSLIGDLVDVVSIDAGKLKVQPERCDAAVLLSEAVDAFAHAASEKGVSIECQTAGGSLLADFDRDRMLQVLANLITNAIKFTPREGEITVRCEGDGHELRFSVCDTGVGIPGNMLEAVFERFWQAGTNDRRGFGLGLYIAKCIVEAHGGRIWAESKLGEGSAFYFRISLEVPRPA